MHIIIYIAHWSERLHFQRFLFSFSFNCYVKPESRNRERGIFLNSPLFIAIMMYTLDLRQEISMVETINLSQACLNQESLHVIFIQQKFVDHLRLLFLRLVF